MTSTRLLPVRADNGKEQTMTQTEVNAAFTDKVRRGIFKPVARHLTDEAPLSSHPGNRPLLRLSPTGGRVIS